MATEVLENLKSLTKKAESKMVLLVVDGLGGIPHPDFDYQTELEAAQTPNLDELAKKSSFGINDPGELWYYSRKWPRACRVIWIQS